MQTSVPPGTAHATPPGTPRTARGLTVAPAWPGADSLTIGLLPTHAPASPLLRDRAVLSLSSKYFVMTYYPTIAELRRAALEFNATADAMEFAAQAAGCSLLQPASEEQAALAAAVANMLGVQP